jgi:hypothetical protein
MEAAAMSALSNDLLALEKQFWFGDAEFYRQNLDDSCLVVFAEMAGPMTKDRIAGMAKDGNQWKKLDLDFKGLIEPTANFAIVSYHASGTRLDGTPHEANASTGYIRRNGGWKMAFHQQTPTESAH